MTEIPAAAYPSHLSDGSLATDPWPGFDLHPIRSTPEGSPIGGLAEGEVELGDVGRQRTHRARAASSAYSSPLTKNVCTKGCQTSSCAFVLPACASEASQSHQTGQRNTAFCRCRIPLKEFRQQSLILHRVKNPFPPQHGINTWRSSCCNCS